MEYPSTNIQTIKSAESVDENDEEISWNCWLRTILSGSGAMILIMFVGVDDTFSSVILPQLKKEGSGILVTPGEETWLANLGIVMAPIASITIGPCLDIFGRKIGLQFFYFITFLGFGVIACAQNVYEIYIGRMICGVGKGLLVCSIVYIVEICHKKQRGYFLAITTGVLSGGVTLSSIINAYLPWQDACLIFSLTASVLFIVQCFVPESPPWLFKQGNEDACIRSLQSLGRSESAIRREIDAMKLSEKEDTEELKFRTFLEPTIWKPFTAMVIFFFLQSASGINDLLNHSVDIAERLGTSYDSLDVAMTFTATRFAASSTIAVIIRSIIGRKLSTASSGFLMTVALVATGVYEYEHRNVKVSNRPTQWLPIVLYLIYIVASVLGLLSLPWSMSGEVFPLRVRGTMTGVSHLAGYCFMLTFDNMYLLCVDTLQIYGMLFAFAGFSFLAIFFGMFVLPETQNKSLREIEQGFMPTKEDVVVEKYRNIIDYQ